MAARRKWTTEVLTPGHWPQLERLFGERGACGGCWCMYWRQERGEKWEELKGAVNRRRFRALVRTGAAKGVLAFADGEPVGWCAFGRRSEFCKVERSPSMSGGADTDEVWSLPCFFVRSGYRGEGVAARLLRAALAELRRLGARTVEGYPTQPKAGTKVAAAFAFTGVPSLFEQAGFEAMESKPRGKIRMRRKLRGRR